MLLSTSTGTLGKLYGYENAIRRIAKAGFDAFDIGIADLQQNPEHVFNQDNYLEYVNHLKNVMDEVGIVCNQCHGPFPVAVNGWDSYNELTFKAVERAMEVASILGAKNVVVHPIKPNISSRLKVKDAEEFIPFKSEQEVFEYNMEWFRKVIPLCEKYKIRIAIENMWIEDKKRKRIITSCCGMSDDFIKYYDTLNNPWISGCYDIGHGALAGEEPQDAIRALGHRVQCLHVNDNNYIADIHRLPFTESIDFLEVCQALKDINYQGDLTYECDPFIKKFPDDFRDEALAFACKLGRYMISKIEG